MKTALREAVEHVTDKRSSTALPAIVGDRFTIMPDNVLLGHGLSVYAKVVWAMLRRHADENGQCFPSIVALSRELEVSVRRVQYAMRELEALHFLKVTCRKVGAHNYTNSYQLQGFEQRAREQARQPLVSIEDCVTAKGGANRAPGGANRAPGTIFTELEETKEKSRDLSAAADQPPLSPSASKIMRTETTETTYSSVQELWNSVCGAAGMPRINRLDGKRKSAVNRLLRDYTLDQLSDFFHQAAASDFLSGRRPSREHKNWRATFDWLCTEHVLLKLSEGDYNNNQPATDSHRAGLVSSADSCPQTGTTWTEPTPEEVERNKVLIRQLRGGIARHMEASPASDFDGAEDHIHEEQPRPGLHGSLDRLLPASITKQHAVSPHGSFDNSVDVLHEYNVVPEF